MAEDGKFSVTDTHVLKKMDVLIGKVDAVGDEVAGLKHSLKEHKERHAMVMDMLMLAGKLLIGVPTFLSIIGGAVYGFYRMIKGTG